MMLWLGLLSEELISSRWFCGPGYRFRTTFPLPRRFISISHTVSGRFSRHSAKWLTPTNWWIHNILGAIRQTHGYESGLIRKSGFKSRITFGRGLQVRTVWAQFSLIVRPTAAQSPSRCTKCNSSPINGHVPIAVLLYNGTLLYGFNASIKWLIVDSLCCFVIWRIVGVRWSDAPKTAPDRGAAPCAGRDRGLDRGGCG